MPALPVPLPPSHCDETPPSVVPTTTSLVMVETRALGAEVFQKGANWGEKADKFLREELLAKHDPAGRVYVRRLTTPTSGKVPRRWSTRLWTR